MLSLQILIDSYFKSFSAQIDKLYFENLFFDLKQSVDGLKIKPLFKNNVSEEKSPSY